MKLAATLLEQATSSAGSFAFFLLAARLLGPEAFGSFSLVLVCAQVIHTVAVQWILLPITSTSGDTPLTPWQTVAWRVGTLAIVAFVFGYSYGSAFAASASPITFATSAAIVFLGLTSLDALRFYNIRYTRNVLQSLANAARWGLATGALFVLAAAEASPHSPVYALAIGYVGAAMFQFVGFAKRHNEQATDKALPAETRDGRMDQAMLGLGMANAIYTVITTAVLASASIAAFGAYQAFRSLVNWAPLLLQYMETHFASRLANARRRTFVTPRFIAIAVAATVGGAIVSWIWRDQIVTVLIGKRFEQYSWILTVMFVIVMIQSLSRAISIEVRLLNAARIVHVQTLILLTASAALGLGTHGAGFVPLEFSQVVGLLTGVAAVQLLASMKMVNMEKRK